MRQPALCAHSAILRTVAGRSGRQFADHGVYGRVRRAAWRTAGVKEYYYICPRVAKCLSKLIFQLYLFAETYAGMALVMVGTAICLWDKRDR